MKFLNDFLSSVNSTADNRNGTADILKGLAVIFMIQVHITEVFMNSGFYNGIAGKISLFFGGTPAAPVFMAVMGYFIALSKRDYHSALLRGLTLFLGGIILNIALNASLIVQFFLRKTDVNIFQFIFAVDILPLAGLSIIVLALIKHYFRGGFVVPAIMLLTVLIANSVVNPVYSPENIYLRYILAFVYTHEPWSYFPLLPWLIYPLSGYIYANFQKQTEVKSRTVLVSLGVLFFFFALSLGFVVDVITDLPAYYHHGTILILWNLLFLYWFALAINLLEKAAGGSRFLNWIKWNGRNVTTAYVIQWLIIGNTGTFIYKSMPNYFFYVSFPVLLILVSLLTFLWLKYKSRIITENE